MPHSDTGADVTARALALCEAARARADAATPGPWGMGERLLDNDPTGAWDIFAHDTDLVEEGDIGSGACVLASRAPWGHYADRSIANGNFIAHARADLPMLADIAEAGLALREALTIQLMPRVSGCRVCRFATGEHRHDCPVGAFDAAIRAAGEAGNA